MRFSAAHKKNHLNPWSSPTITNVNRILLQSSSVCRKQRNLNFHAYLLTISQFNCNTALYTMLLGDASRSMMIILHPDR